jgi:hypothetical protein
VIAVGRVNDGDYRHDMIDDFTGAQLARIYRLNPVWAEIERRAYGAVPID